MADAVEAFVADQNIKRYKSLLQEETHPDKRRILLQLLAEEVEKLTDPNKWTKTPRTNQISIT